jgi:hypothetical protein
MNRVHIGLLLCASVIAAANIAQAQGREAGSIERTPPPQRTAKLPDRSPKPATAETEAWIARDIQAGPDWRLVSKDADGLVLAKPTGAVTNQGVVPMHLRIEYRNPLTINKREVRSVSADLDVDCGSLELNGQVAGFEAANLSGRKMSLVAASVAQGGPGAGQVVTLNPRAEGLKLLTNTVVREQCAEGHRAIASRYGPEWRPVLSDESGVRLIGGGDKVGLDRKIDVTFRIEAQAVQADPKLKWRSAISKVKLDCVDGVMSADTTLYSGVNETGTSAELAFEGMLTPAGLRTHAPGEALAPTAGTAQAASGGRGGLGRQSGDTGPGKSVVDMLGNGGAMLLSECDVAKAKLANALATPGDPVRQQAEAWVGQNLNTKGFRLPIYVPEGVFLLSDEVAAAPGGARRAVVRAEFSRPVPGRNGKKMASRIVVIEVDCNASRVRGTSENTYAKNGARELVSEMAAPQAAWASFEEQPVLAPYYQAVCVTNPSS